MKILYVKINSERARQFQLKTVVFEENGKKFVKKQAMHTDAIPHLKKMKENYTKLSNAVIDSRIKLVPIVAESDDSLTFEFIEGISLEKQYNHAKKKTPKTADTLIEAYTKLVKNGFKTSVFDSKMMVTDAFKATLGDFDYTVFDGELCFDGISNIDLIFSNIIFKDEEIYLIDYEWVYALNIPIDFAIFRALHRPNDLHWDMEKHFVFDLVVGEKGFLNIQKQYAHPRLSGLEELKAKDAQIENLNTIVKDKSSIIYDKEVHIYDLKKMHRKILRDKEIHIDDLKKTHHKILHDKDVHIHNQENTINDLHHHINDLSNLVESMRLKNRAKRLIKKCIPTPFWAQLQKIKHTITPLENIETTSSPTTVENNYHYTAPIYTDAIAKEIEIFKSKPLISIIMPVYNVAPKWLALAIASIESQWYTNWELCMVDDKSTDEETLTYLRNIDNPKIKVKFLEENLNISGASNAALALTSGEYIALMDNDDELTPDALYEVVKAINIGAEFIYSDEDKLEMDGSYSDPHFKPDFAPDMFLSQNYLSHLGVIKKSLIIQVKGFTLGLEGSQDFDLYLKVLEHTDKIHHITKVLYHWRKIPGSTASEYGEKSYAQEAGKKALENAMQRRGINASVKNGQTPGTYKVDYDIQGEPLVSIVIPFKDKPELLTVCVESILEKSTYGHFEIIGISNNSEEEATFEEMRRLESLDERVHFYEYNVPFNYSQINNYAVETYAKGEQILFLNNDIEIITPSWIEEMLMYSQQPQNGAIGAKLFFPNDTIQHAGLILVPKTIHSVILVYQGYPREHYGYVSRLKCVNNYSALTAACLMVKRSIVDEVEGFDAKRLSVAYNDVDLCLRIREAGYHNVWTPYAQAYHHESISRGHEKSVEDVERREKEKWHLKDKHPEIFSKGDPYYNPQLTRFGVGSEIATEVSKSNASVKGYDFLEEIDLSLEIQGKQKDIVSIFSHFDAQNEIKEDVLYYLKSLAKISDIVFVSTAEDLSTQAIQSIEPYCRDIIVKKNIGYDFGAWKTGLNHLGTALDTYESLILCNDSVYGPLFDLSDIVNSMKSYDFWSMTDNYEIEYHLQSYFMVYTKTAFKHPVFQAFWGNFKIYEDKQTLIEHNEIGFSQAMMNTGLSYHSYYSVKNKNYVNVLQYHWDTLITEHQFPFIKKELLKRNPLQLPIDNWTDIVQSVSNYDAALIQNQLNS